VVIKNIFIDPTCGNNLCEAPEEYPEFQAAHDSRQFIGCKADCGEADQTEVTVNFYDPWKLFWAYKAIDDAFENGWQGLTAETWGAANIAGERTHDAAAGWNICSKNKKE